MERLFKSFHSLHELKFRPDDDYVDRLSRQYTSLILVCFAFLVSTRQFVGKPISCWCPAQFTDSHREYANTICWVSNTFYLPTDDTIQQDMSTIENERQHVSYYQWVPFILMFEAALAFTPCLLWRFLHRRSGINLPTIMDAARVCSGATYVEIREKAIRHIVNQLDRYMLAQRDYRTGCYVRVKLRLSKLCCLVGGRLYGNYLISAYLLVKCLYVANAVGQLFLLDAMLGIDYHMYGLRVVQKLFRGKDWSVAECFPRVTLCDFSIRHQARLHSYVVQCVLTINLFNEKIFIFVWFWFVFVAIVSVSNMVYWIIRALHWSAQVRYVTKQLRAFDAQSSQREPGAMTRFTTDYLRRDGLFVIRLVAMNMGEIVAAEVLTSLWHNYGPERRAVAEKGARRQQQHQPQQLGHHHQHPSSSFSMASGKNFGGGVGARLRSELV